MGVSLGVAPLPGIERCHSPWVSFGRDTSALQLEHCLSQRPTSLPKTRRLRACGGLNRCLLLGRECREYATGFRSPEAVVIHAPLGSLLLGLTPNASGVVGDALRTLLLVAREILFESPEGLHIEASLLGFGQGEVEKAGNLRERY